MEFIKKLKEYGPVLFGIGFMAPLIAQAMDAVSVAAPAGIPNLVVGLSVGLVLGSIAKLRGRWI